MYRIINMAGSVTTRLQRRVAIGRRSRTRIYRFMGRRILPKKSLQIPTAVFEKFREQLEADERMGMIKIVHIPNGDASVTIEATPEVEPCHECGEPSTGGQNDGMGPVYWCDDHTGGEPPVEEPGEKPEPMKTEEKAPAAGEEAAASGGGETEEATEPGDEGEAKVARPDVAVEDLTAEAVEGDEDDPEDKTEEALPSEAVEGLKDELGEQVEASQVEGVSDIPPDDTLESMPWRELQKLAKEKGVKARKKDDILIELSDMREAELESMKEG